MAPLPLSVTVTSPPPDMPWTSKFVERGLHIGHFGLKLLCLLHEAAEILDHVRVPDVGCFNAARGT